VAGELGCEFLIEEGAFGEVEESEVFSSGGETIFQAIYPEKAFGD